MGGQLGGYFLRGDRWRMEVWDEGGSRDYGRVGMKYVKYIRGQLKYLWMSEDLTFVNSKS